MIAYIKGHLAMIQDESVIVDVHGVGYELVCANPFSFQSSLNKEVLINTYHYVREDTQVLFGFKNEDEKYLFTKLISVSGIGPKGALAILAGVDIAGFVSAIEQEDDKFLTSFPGVGKKTARQIILDLKGKLTTVFSVNAKEEKDLVEQEGNASESYREAEEALKALGYTDREVKSVIPVLKKEKITNTDEIIRKALGLLVRN
ncbi:Holliday junction branch migration protein RuvA [Oceanobacillus damuensis]|uniref:Holliday junction branch migration protein RuvA n=1 Tax=Oceanobacillus damuensis TaxID=937928 RepID=UPI00082DE460|nr:Holliday junction branch migration protein RuvA [Oceanobacillus damuensis]